MQRTMLLQSIPKNATDKQSFFDEIGPITTAVEATGKLTTTWADIKQK